MNRLLSGILLTLLIIQQAEAQGIAPISSKTLIRKLRELVPAKARLSKRISVIVDVSGSMKMHNLVGRAIAAIEQVANQDVDEYELAITAFWDAHARWPGIEEEGVPKGWAKMPSKVAVDSAKKWLTKFDGDGGTAPLHAVREAISEKRESLSILFVSDGDFIPDHVLLAIEVGQARREELHLGRAVIAVLGIGRLAETKEHMATMGRDGLGGFWTDD